MRIEDTTILITDDSILARKQLKDIISTLGTHALPLPRQCPLSDGRRRSRCIRLPLSLLQTAVDRSVPRAALLHPFLIAIAAPTV